MVEETTKKKKIVNNEDSKKKERHIVTWTQEEDDILRTQINLHGTVNWAIIASKFTDKSTRQCRRRWYTYLNSDFKRGGWSPEEDALLCEAQRLFGNRWTEIAKVVSGRTDNAVKNRFTTLCKKKAKYEAMAKENMNSNNKRMLFPDGISTPRKAESESPLAKKLRRSHIPDLIEITSYGDRSHIKLDSNLNHQIRPPFSVLAHNEEQNQTGYEVVLKKDDPKVTALMQQAEFLSSLPQKVHVDNTEQNLESTWKVLQDFLNKNIKFGISDMDFQFEEFKDHVESSNEDSQTSWRQPDLHDSPASSHCSESTVATTQEPNHLIVSDPTLEQIDLLSTSNDAIKNTNEIVPISVNEDFNSPVQVTPLFKSLAAGIPSPQFSESERNFLIKTLGVESPSPCPNACKRVLLNSL